MKLVLIGCGHIARSMHMPAIRQIQSGGADYQIAACCDLRAEAAQAFAQEYGLDAWYTDMDEMLQRERPDGAICLVHESVNHQVAGELLRRGIPTLLEKPPGRTIAEFEHLVQCQQQKGTAHLVAFNRRYAPAYVQAREALGGEPLRYIDYRMYRQNRREPTFETTAIHAIDAVAYLAASPYAHLDIRYQPLALHGERVANMLLSARMQNGAAVTIRILVSTGDVQEGCELHTDEQVVCAGLTAPYARGGSYLYQLRGGERRDLISPDDPSSQCRVYANGFVGEHQAFADCALRGGPVPSHLDDVRQSVALCQALADRAACYEDS